MMPLIIRDLQLAMRSSGAWLHGVLFLSVFATLCAVALGGDKTLLTPLAPALLWLAVLLSLLLSFEKTLAEDARDGTLEQLYLSPLSLPVIAASKLISAWVLAVLPLLIMTPLLGYSFGMNGPALIGTMLALIIGTPALLVYGLFASACLISYRSAGLLLILLTVPLMIPTLIFGLGAVDSYAAGGLLTTPYQALAGISLLSVGLGIPAIAAALKTHLETS